MSEVVNIRHYLRTLPIGTEFTVLQVQKNGGKTNTAYHLKCWTAKGFLERQGSTYTLLDYGLGEKGPVPEATSREVLLPKAETDTNPLAKVNSSSLEVRKYLSELPEGSLFSTAAYAAEKGLSSRDLATLRSWCSRTTSKYPAMMQKDIAGYRIYGGKGWLGKKAVEDSLKIEPSAVVEVPAIVKKEKAEPKDNFVLSPKKISLFTYLEGKPAGRVFRLADIDAYKDGAAQAAALLCAGFFVYQGNNRVFLRKALEPQHSTKLRQLTETLRTENDRDFGDEE